MGTMSSLPDLSPALADQLSGPVEVDEPSSAHGLTGYPVFGRPPRRSGRRGR